MFERSEFVVFSETNNINRKSFSRYKILFFIFYPLIIFFLFFLKH